MTHADTIRQHALRGRAPTRLAGPLGRVAVALGAALALLQPGAALAFEDLNEAQSLVYDSAHLATLSEGDEVRYRYASSRAGQDPVEDVATLQVEGESDAERRDVTLDFLSEERHLALPRFDGYRGNPVLIAMLEHIAQSLSATNGGGALYYRNRIRDGLAGESVEIASGNASLGETDIGTTSLEFEPFRGDAYLGARPGVGDARFRIVFSDDVPGGVVSVGASSGELESGASDAVPFDYELRLADAP